MLHYLRADHPDAIVDAMCSGPEQVLTRYGIQAVALSWFQRHEHHASGLKAIVLKVAGKVWTHSGSRAGFAATTS